MISRKRIAHSKEKWVNNKLSQNFKKSWSSKLKNNFKWIKFYKLKKRSNQNHFWNIPFKQRPYNTLEEIWCIGDFSTSHDLSWYCIFSYIGSMHISSKRQLLAYAFPIFPSPDSFQRMKPETPITSSNNMWNFKSQHTKRSINGLPNLSRSPYLKMWLGRVEWPYLKMQFGRVKCTTTKLE